MSNNEIKKFIDHSKLYAEVDLEKNQKVEEGLVDFLKNLFSSGETPEEVVKKLDPKLVKKLDTEIDNNNLDAFGGPGAPVTNNVKGGGQDTSIVGDDPSGAGDAGVGTPTSKLDTKGETPANQQGIDGPADAAAQGTDQEDPGLDAFGGPGAPVGQGTDQEDPEVKAPAASSGGSLLGRKLDTTTPNLMKAYNDGGKKAMPEIKNLQTALSRLGHDPNGLDGKYGQGTYAAVQAFQKANGLSVDGQAGPGTMAAIKKALDDNFEKNKVTPDDTANANNQGKKVPSTTDDAMDPKNQQQDMDTAQPNADVDRYIELLNKLEGTGSTYDEVKPQTKTVTASYDYRDLISLVESK